MITVTCAIIRNEDDEVLVVQRGEETDHPLKWEFPGGKLNPGETEEECIIREIEEELSIDIVICRRLPVVEYDYGIKQIKLIPFVCDTLDELPLLTEHNSFKWLHPSDLLLVDYSEADIIVAKKYLAGIKSDIKPVSKGINENAQNLIDEAGLKDMVNNIMNTTVADWVATSAAENPAIFMKLFEYSCSDDKKLAFKASWTLTKVCDRFPEMIFPYLPQVVEILGKTDNESALRSFLRILSLTDIDKINSSLHGILADYCFDAMKSVESAIAIKVYSMEILYRLSVLYPELANELSALVRILMEDGSGAIISRGGMILKKLAEMPINPKSSQL